MYQKLSLYIVLSLSIAFFSVAATAIPLEYSTYVDARVVCGSGPRQVSSSSTSNLVRGSTRVDAQRSCLQGASGNAFAEVRLSGPSPAFRTFAFVSGGRSGLGVESVSADAYVELVDHWSIRDVPDYIDSVDVGISIGIEGTISGTVTAYGSFYGKAGRFSLTEGIIDTSINSSVGGIQTFQRKLTGGFGVIDTIMRFDAPRMLNVGKADFSNTGTIRFDLSQLPDGAYLASASGFKITKAPGNGGGNATSIDEPRSLMLLLLGGLMLSMRNRVWR